ncbi:MAG: 50S ribosomal protein L33 [Bacilli bacterium]|nr:50S ribosomal protein L33 [Bacilli bacterium]MDD2681780.1 50S ribosomal protein L33 [Bacilli bacterium]MDD3121606.1 50S ribosomal protein L33 [Bacilli bacterium]MDD4062965.1 50S ribosomal protein L33 [Bacilli bacterium]MDD4482323.1 50S ribosomal protein L33 [Bacilli bacterium]
MRVTFLMRCTVCGEENYLTEKNKKNTPDRIEVNKFCPKCRKQTLHKEKTKK